MKLRDAWERVAADWIEWARAPGHDTYWRFHRERFFELIPPPGALTLDVGCGEGRVTRDLKALGHRVISLDASPTMVTAAREADPDGDYRLADAAALPLDDACADLVVAFMSLQDVDDMPGAVHEIARVLVPGGRACLAVVHPLNSAGKFESDDDDSRFVISGSYLEPGRTVDLFERDGYRMTFQSAHYPLEAYAGALERAGFLMEAIREPRSTTLDGTPAGTTNRWLRVPLFLHVRAVKPR
jgi:SAM-dependent methyltransferase